MANYYYYGYDFAPPLADHMHQRTHQHRNLFHYLTHQKPRPEDFPNQPDVDVRDAVTEYLIDMEVPGIQNPHEISVSWTSTRSLVISGNIAGPEPGKVVPEKHENKTGTRDANGSWKDSEPHGPEIILQERRIGPFRRRFNFPDEANMEKLTAKLEAGLLKVRVPKIGLSVTKTGKVDVQ